MRSRLIQHVAQVPLFPLFSRGMSRDAILANDRHAHNASAVSGAGRPEEMESGHGLHDETPRFIHPASPHYS